MSGENVSSYRIRCSELTKAWVHVRKNGPPKKFSVGVAFEGGTDTLPLLRGYDIVIDNIISIIFC